MNFIKINIFQVMIRVIICCCFVISCSKKEKIHQALQVQKQVEKKEEVINYSKIDSSLLSISDAYYLRLDENWMKKRALKFKELSIDLTPIKDWSTNSMIEEYIDEDTIKDYIVVVKSQLHPKMDIHYKIIVVLGKSFKSYEIPDCSWPITELEELTTLDEIHNPGFTEYELPMVELEKVENVITIFCRPNRGVDSFNPYYYDTEKDKFEIIYYD